MIRTEPLLIEENMMPVDDGSVNVRIGNMNLGNNWLQCFSI